MILTLAVGLAFCSSTPQAVYGLKVAHQKTKLPIPDADKRGADYIKFISACDKPDILSGKWQQDAKNPAGAFSIDLKKQSCRYQVVPHSQGGPAVYVGYVMRDCGIGKKNVNQVCVDTRKPKPEPNPTTIELPLPEGKGNFKARDMWFNPNCGSQNNGCWVYDEDGKSNGEYYAEIVEILEAIDINVLAFKATKSCDGHPNQQPRPDTKNFSPVTLPALIALRQTKYRWVQSGQSSGSFQYIDSEDQTTPVNNGCLMFDPENKITEFEKAVDITVVFADCGSGGQLCAEKPPTANGLTTVTLPGPNGYIEKGTCMWYDPDCGLKGCWIYGEGECNQNEPRNYRAVIVE